MKGMRLSSAPPERGPLIETHAVTRQFGSLIALRATDLKIDRGAFVSIMGRSGSGKSTLLNILGLLDRPTSGEYLIAGREVGNVSERERAAIRAAMIGFVFQAFHLIPHRTTLENVQMGLLYQPWRRLSRRDEHRLACDALDRVGLRDRAFAFPTTLSGGEKQRAAIARALVGNPAVLLADEPTGNLDTANSEQVLDLFSELHDTGQTIVMITHDEQIGARAQVHYEMVDGVLART